MVIVFVIGFGFIIVLKLIIDELCFYYSDCFGYIFLVFDFELFCIFLVFINFDIKKFMMFDVVFW